MISFPNAKINIGLFVTEKRQDGFHNLESLFYPVNWTDILEIIESKSLQFTSTGIHIPGEQSENLCLKAWNILNKKFSIPPVNIHLHKVIPIGAGLGGGSSDASFTLKLLNKKFDLNLPDEELESLARTLGSDCAFFIKNKPVIALEKGDIFRSTKINLKGKHIVLIYPNIHITTKEAYAGIRPSPLATTLDEILLKPIQDWKLELKNNFEEHLFLKYPVLNTIKNDLYSIGAIFASMTGSGSCLYGIFDSDPDTSIFQKQDFLVKKCLPE